MLAWDLLRFVPDRLYKVAGRVTFPAFCLQDDQQELARAYRDFFVYIAKVALWSGRAAVAAPDASARSTARDGCRPRSRCGRCRRPGRLGRDLGSFGFDGTRRRGPPSTVYRTVRAW